MLEQMFHVFLTDVLHPRPAILSGWAIFSKDSARWSGIWPVGFRGRPKSAQVRCTIAADTKHMPAAMPYPIAIPADTTSGTCNSPVRSCVNTVRGWRPAKSSNVSPPSRNATCRKIVAVRLNMYRRPPLRSTFRFAANRTPISHSARPL